MNINLKKLNEAIKHNRRPPNFAGEKMQLPVMNVVQTQSVKKANFTSIDENYQVITIVAVAYCEAKEGCWLEWELEI